MATGQSPRLARPRVLAGAGESENCQASQRGVFRHRLEGENDLNGLVLAILTEMQPFDFSKSFYSEFAIANAVSELLLKSIGVDTCCGNE
jgi:hypothetical protein